MKAKLTKLGKIYNRLDFINYMLGGYGETEKMYRIRKIIQSYETR